VGTEGKVAGEENWEEKRICREGGYWMRRGIR